MAALQDEWQAARKNRQQEVAQRREMVLADLRNHHDKRQQDTVELRQTLAEYYASVQAETLLYLTQVSQQRQTQARRTAVELQAFDTGLKAYVAALRGQYQLARETVKQSVAELQQATQQTLAGHGRDRAVRRSRQQETLSAYVESLTVSVADTLNDFTEQRQLMAVQNQAQRHRDREALTADVQTMRDDFAVYRQQMIAFRENLRRSVWGTTMPQAPATPPTPPVNDPQPGRSQKTRTKAPVRLTAVASAPESVLADSPPLKVEVPTEEAVFDYLQNHSDGARLTEIETTLGINRFQAVDALRSLIQKELIIQKDRTYHIQEEVVL